MQIETENDALHEMHPFRGLLFACPRSAARPLRISAWQVSMAREVTQLGSKTSAEEASFSSGVVS